MLFQNQEHALDDIVERERSLDQEQLMVSEGGASSPKAVPWILVLAALALRVRVRTRVSDGGGMR